MLGFLRNRAWPSPRLPEDATVSPDGKNQSPNDKTGGGRSRTFP
jgi:hypothetical protein